MNNPHKINEAYSQFFIEWACKNLTASRVALLVTTTFEHEASGRRRRETEGLPIGAYERTAFKHLYNLACRSVVGSNYNRPSKRDQLPRVAAFLDSEGTKFWRRAGEFEGIHIHSVWIIEANEVEAIKTAIDLAGQNSDFFRALGFDAIDIKAIEPTDDDLARVVRYASKMLGFNSRDLKMGMDFEVYPLGVR